VGTINTIKLLNAVKAAKYTNLIKKVILGVNLYNKHELNKALIGVSFLNSQSLYRKSSF
jgi:hypothetical protein